MNMANTGFVAATALAALSQRSAVFIAARVLTGLAVATNVLAPAIVGDMFVNDQRGAAMSLIMLAPLLGGAVGPAIAGAIAQTVGWRYVLWLGVALAGVCEVLFLTCFRETYKVAILRRRAARLRKETCNPSLRTVFDPSDEEEDKSSAGSFWADVVRPFGVFFRSGVLMSLALFGSVIFSYFYVLSVSLPDILEDTYGLSPAASGSVFISFSKLFQQLGLDFAHKPMARPLTLF